jgi:N-acetylglutamate synthase-like GNAT family acetyltransferase
MTFLIRPAVAADQEAILALARGERVNPNGLHWPNFVVAERDGALTGAVQLRLHRDGSRELGTLVVERMQRNQGIAARLIDALLSCHSGRILMITGRKHANHYARWGFAPITPRQAPTRVSRNYWMGTCAGYVFAALQRRARNPLVILDRPGSKCSGCALLAPALKIPAGKIAA